MCYLGDDRQPHRNDEVILKGTKPKYRAATRENMASKPAKQVCCDCIDLDIGDCICMDKDTYESVPRLTNVETTKVGKKKVSAGYIPFFTQIVVRSLPSVHIPR